MILYLVKWQDGSAGLITAHDEEHLLDVLDHLGDPAAATWKEFEGPLWLEFPRVDHEVPEGDVSPYDLTWIRPIIPCADWAADFADTLIETLHPNYSKAREDALSEERAIPRREFDRAVEDDLMFRLPCSLNGTSHGRVDNLSGPFILLLHSDEDVLKWKEGVEN